MAALAASGASAAQVNRGCTRADVVRAVRLLKDAGYKLDLHLMPNLPGASPEIDRAMFDEALTDPDLQADQWKARRGGRSLILFPLFYFLTLPLI